MSGLSNNVRYDREQRERAKADQKCLATIDYEGQYLPKDCDRNRLTAQMLLTPDQGRRLIEFYSLLIKEQSDARKAKKPNKKPKRGK